MVPSAPNSIPPLPAEADPLSIVDVLASFPAEGAVFTTFTLSLTFFETYLLRSLERAGCRDVVVLADPIGVADAAHERLARGPGVAYALEPVRLPGGAFHPKIAVLWSGERILLAVGSGNLTFSGMLRNIEVWDVLVSGADGVRDERRLTADVAGAAAAFVDELGRRVHAGGRARATLGRAARALRTCIPRLPPGRGAVTWIDSLEFTIGEQIAAIASTPGVGGTTLAVLAPFHDPTGEAVTRLATALGASRLDVLFTGDSTSCPLDELARTGMDIRSVRVHRDAQRPLHAKVFAAHRDGTGWVVTGSPNATRQALWTTGNVEVALVRKVERAGLRLVAGEEASPSRVVPPPLHRAAPDIALTSARRSGGRLQFSLWCSRDVRGERVRYRLVGEAAVREVAWAADGPYDVEYPGPFNPLDPRPARLEVEVETDDGPARAIGWIAFDEFLDAPPAYRAGASAFTRLLAGDPDHAADEDDLRLLELFTEQHGRTIHTLSVPPNSRRAGSGTATANDAPIALQLLEALSNNEGAIDAASPSEHSRAWVEHVIGAMRSVFRRLDLGMKSLASNVPDDEDDDADEGGVARTAGDPAVQRRLRAALERFEAVLLEEAQKLRERPSSVAAVLQYLTLCIRLALRYRALSQASDASLQTSLGAFVGSFLMPSAEARRGPLLPLLSSGERLDEEPYRTLATAIGVLALASDLDPAGLRQALGVLERAGGRSVDRDDVISEIPLGFSIAPGAVVDALMDLQRAPEPGAGALRLKQEIEAARIGEAVPSRMRPAEHDAILRAVTRRPDRWDRIVRFVEPWATVCPGCHGALATASLPVLGRHDVAQCRNTACSRWLVPSEGR